MEKYILFQLTVALGLLLPSASFCAAEKPSAVLISSSWERFHGPNGAGYVAGAKLPVTWDAGSGKNIIWKTTIPLAGFSSPVIEGDKVFITAATNKEQRVLCLSTTDGKIIWEKKVACERAFKAEELNISPDTTFAAPTPSTDGNAVYVLFASGDLAALGVSDGKLIWEKNLGEPESTYGIASCPVLFEEFLILSYPGKEAIELRAFDKKTGKPAWSSGLKDAAESWASPLIIGKDKDAFLVYLASPKMYGFDPRNGKELWSIEAVAGEICPSPIYAGGLIFAAQARSGLVAVRPPKAGSKDEPVIVWSVPGSENLPDVSTPASDGKRLFLATADELYCYEVKTGKLLWKQEVKGDFYSSPVIAGDMVYATTREGTTLIFRSADIYEAVGEGTLGPDVNATPAISGNKIFIRGDKELFCIGNK